MNIYKLTAVSATFSFA